MNLRRTVASAAIAASVLPAAVLTATAAHATEPERPWHDLSSCHDVADAVGGYREKTLKLVRTDVGSPVVRGGGWRSFRATVTNVSDKDVSPVWVSVAVYRESEREAPFVSEFIDFEYKSGRDGKWTPVDRNASSFVTAGALKAGASVTYDLRLRAAAELPWYLSSSTVDVSATFLDHFRMPDGRVEPCTAGTDERKTLKVVEPAAEPTPGTPKPGTSPDGGAKPEPAKPRPTPTASRPTGSATPTAAPATPGAETSATAAAVPARNPSGTSGNLAETGSSDALPTVALIGGAAVVAGGAAVLITRRRRTG
ncbi:LAETG motif-containing sortase-dependent surface protein [Streptomyces chrestomyceticus]|uniref:LAETG motif-containing sortase-dependent surface protein n=1 Tax=Streptomyces chrestomyceticus TaxID=68185 RepID=UPI0019D0C90C|nr:LAETG motif-containing sortase-dependent surface protein [Streptomyces chrestomyceticus]